ncbi:MAG: hypothetical protein E7231_07635 [Cellulosilyticum sp.]|nr:hypothetical protein [Cellulosilyticum sp.]
MNTNQTIAVLKAFYFGSDSIAAIANRTKLSRDEVREALRGARECGLIKYSTRDYNETFVHKDSKKLGEYLKAKGIIKPKRK